MEPIKEVCLVLRGGESLRFPTATEDPDGIGYVRFADAAGNDIAYWDSDEWRDEPREVMASIMGCLTGKFPGRVESGTLGPEGGE